MGMRNTLKRRVNSSRPYIARRLTRYAPRWPVPVLQAPVLACCVYRVRNAGFVERMISQLPDQTEIRLHALDSIAPTLERLTVSEGPGLRMPLLQSLMSATPYPEGTWLVVFDDDAEFASEGKTTFLDVASAAGFDIAGAAIDVGNPRTFDHSLVSWGSTARTVEMVEIGPVVAFSPKAVPRVTPFPPDSGMGWGYDVIWAGMADLRKGYVDATPIRHHGAVAVAYNKDEEVLRLKRELARAGIASSRVLASSREKWPWWRSQPPWLDSV